jgi:polysaccharide biosynthesis/export protein
MPRLIVIMATAAAALCAATPALSQAAPTAIGQAPLPPPDPAASARLPQSEYFISPYDTLEITVFGVEDLTRTVQVDAAGHITYPLIGQVAAAARTARDLEATIAAKLGERYLQSPQVMVLVKAAPGQKFTVEGAVASPGIYDINGRMTLLQAIATAKGLETAANPRNVVVFRLIEGRRMAGLADLSEIRSGKLNDPQIYAGDVIVVESSRTKALLRTMLGTVPLFNLLLL